MILDFRKSSAQLLAYNFSAKAQDEALKTDLLQKTQTQFEMSAYKKEEQTLKYTLPLLYALAKKKRSVQETLCNCSFALFF